MCLQIDVLQKILKKSEKWKKKLPFWIIQYSKICDVQRCFRGNQRCSALNQRCFRDFQVMKSAETDLKVFWIRATQRWMSPRSQPGSVSVLTKSAQKLIALHYKHFRRKSTIYKHSEWNLFRKIVVFFESIVLEPSADICIFPKINPK